MNEQSEREIDKPPFFNSWAGMYYIVLGALVGEIILFYAITLYFA